MIYLAKGIFSSSKDYKRKDRLTFEYNLISFFGVLTTTDILLRVDVNSITCKTSNTSSDPSRA
jgi:hypothetical protein